MQPMPLWLLFISRIDFFEGTKHGILIHLKYWFGWKRPPWYSLFICQAMILTVNPIHSPRLISSWKPCQFVFCFFLKDWRIDGNHAIVFLFISGLSLMEAYAISVQICSGLTLMIAMLFKLYISLFIRRLVFCSIGRRHLLELN